MFVGQSMEASTSISGDISPHTQRAIAAQTLNRANRPLQLPTVCVSTIPPTLSAVVAAAVAQSPLHSPVFVDTNNQVSQVSFFTFEEYPDIVDGWLEESLSF